MCPLSEIIVCVQEGMPWSVSDTSDSFAGTSSFEPGGEPEREKRDRSMGKGNLSFQLRDSPVSAMARYGCDYKHHCSMNRLY